MEIIQAIKLDHTAIRRLINRGLAPDATLSEKIAIYKKILRHVQAYIWCEENVVYSMVSNRSDLKKLIHLCVEEHSSIDEQLEKLKMIRRPAQWLQKFKSLCNQLKQHMENEELRFLPKLKHSQSFEWRRNTGNLYEETFLRLLRNSERLAAIPVSPDVESQERGMALS